MNKAFFGLFVSLWMVTSCSVSNHDLGIDQLKDQLQDVRDGQALVRVFINNQDFYQSVEPFEAVVQTLPQLLKISLLNKKNSSNIEFEGICDSWYQRRPKRFELKNHSIGEIGGDQVVLMIGKLIQQPQLRGDGYILAQGMITLRELNQAYIVLVFEGNVVKPGQAITPENYLPTKGCILIKKPKLTPESNASILQ